MSMLSRLFSRGAAADARTSDSQAWLQKATHQAADQVINTVGQQLRGARRSLQTAETPAWTASWSTTAGNINDLLAQQLPIIRDRSRGLARNDEWAARYLLQLEDNVLGPRGIALQMRLRNAAGKFDTDANAAYEAFFARWCKRGNCETSGKLDWREVEAMLLICEEQCGEVLYQLRPGRGPFGFQIRLLDPTLLDVNLRRNWQGRRVRMGIEIDDDGAPVAYWLRMSKAGDAASSSDVMAVGRHVRVPAEQIRHHFVSTEIDQLRGVPGLSIGARRLWQLHDFEESAAVATSNAAKREGFFFSPDGNAPPGMADHIVSTVLAAAAAEGKTLTAEEVAALQASATKYATTMPGQFDTLPVGYDFKPFESKWPDISAEGHIKSQVRAWSAARGVSYHTLGNDLESVNYSSAQVGIGDERQHFKVRQRRLISWLHADVIEHVLKRAALYQPGVKASRLDEALASVQWLPRTWPPIDVLKKAEADDIALRNKSTTRRQIWQDEGKDPDDMTIEVLEEEKTFGALDAPATAGTAKRSARHDDAERDELGGGASVALFTHRNKRPAADGG
jgi:lambda family phage portal protein